jgi:SsrA-binding protein
MATKSAPTSASKAAANSRPIASNRRARHDFSILETVEAGIELRGSEVKSLRLGNVQLADAYARVERGQVWLEGVHVAPYAFAHGVGSHDPDRRRRLLLHAEEIAKLSDRIAQERLTLVPLSLYLKDGRVKVELGLAKGRTKGDKRQAIAERDADREIQKALGRQRKGME